MGDYWVCQYGNTRGNTNGYFEENVLAPVRSVAECGGTSSDVPDVVQQATTTTTTTTTTTVATTTTTTTAAQLECSYKAHVSTGVTYKGTGGSKLKRSSFESFSSYLDACKASCNADPSCGGFVDDFSNIFLRRCKPKTASDASEGRFRAFKTFYI